MNPDQLAAARTRLSLCRNAHEVAALLLELLGLDRDTAYQAMPEMNQRTVRRITAELSESDDQDGKRESLKDAVRRYTCFLSLQKKHTHADRTAPELPAELWPVKEAAEQARVSPVKALEAVARYGNPVDVVLRRLRDLGTLAEHVSVRNPTGLFVHLMRHGKEVVMPEAVTARREAGRQPQAEPLRVGDTLTYYGEAATVERIERTTAYVLTASGDEYRMPAEQAQRLRDLPAPAPQPAQKPQRDPAPAPCPPERVRALLEGLRAKVGRVGMA